MHAISVTTCVYMFSLSLSLSSSQVAYACHRFDDSSEAVFLQATFTCCPDSQQDADSQQQAQTQVLGNIIIMDFYHTRLKW